MSFLKVEFPDCFRLLSVCFMTAFLMLPGVAAADTLQVDFDEALRGVQFDPATLDFNGEGQGVGNGVPDAIELALISAVLADANLDFSTDGGVSHDAVYAAYVSGIEVAMTDLEPLLATWSTSAEVGLGYAMLGATSFQQMDAMVAGFGVGLDGDYSFALAVGEWFKAEGDADGDGFSNIEEFSALSDRSASAYVAAALDPSAQPDTSQPIELVSVNDSRKTLGIILYPGFEVLDVYGPLEMWAYVPDYNIVMIAEEAGPVMSAQGVATVATHSFETAPQLDIVMVPGGTGSRQQLENQNFLDYLEVVNETTEFTTSVCTGSALLAKAGVLNGHRATANKRFFFLSEQQSKEVDWVVDARWVESGKMFTSSGVSAGTDMALGLVAKTHGIQAARDLASSVEYEWHEEADVDPFAQFVQRAQPEGIGLGELIRSEPAAGTELQQTPRFLRLYFDRLPEVSASTVTLHRTDDPDTSIPLPGMHNMGADDLMMSVGSELTPGTYVVRWNASYRNEVSPQSGEFEFVVASQ